MGKVKVWDYNVPSCLCLEGVMMGKHFVRLAHKVGARGSMNAEDVLICDPKEAQ